MVVRRNYAGEFHAATATAWNRGVAPAVSGQTRRVKSTRLDNNAPTKGDLRRKHSARAISPMAAGAGRLTLGAMVLRDRILMAALALTAASLAAAGDDALRTVSASATLTVPHTLQLELD